jgi:hypothetical protein
MYYNLNKLTYYSVNPPDVFLLFNNKKSRFFIPHPIKKADFLPRTPIKKADFFIKYAEKTEKYYLQENRLFFEK